jgi:hypothetical protein
MPGFRPKARARYLNTPLNSQKFFASIFQKRRSFVQERTKELLSVRQRPLPKRRGLA